MEENREQEITAAEFARRKKRSESWARNIAQRAIKELPKRDYPRKMGNYWQATEKEWEKLIKSLGIRMRKPKKRKNKR